MAIEKAAKEKLKDLALEGANTQGNIVCKLNAAENAAKKASRLGKWTKALKFLGRASGVVGAFATGYQAGAWGYCAVECVRE
jgi:hypothetical protein